MFGIDGPEFVVILIVLIVVVGPKDLPKMLKALGKATARMRATANEFRRQFDEAMHEADLDDLQKTISDVGDLDPRKKLTKIFDPIRDVAKDVKASIEVKEIAKDTGSERLSEEKTTDKPKNTVGRQMQSNTKEDSSLREDDQSKVQPSGQQTSTARSNRADKKKSDVVGNAKKKRKSADATSMTMSVFSEENVSSSSNKKKVVKTAKVIQPKQKSNKVAGSGKVKTSGVGSSRK